MVKVKFSKLIKPFVYNNSDVEIDADSYYNLYSNLSNLFPDLAKVTSSLAQNKRFDIWFLVDNKILPYQDIFLPVKKGKEIVIVPLVAGSGEEGLMIAIGIAIIVASVVLLQPQFGMAAAFALTSTSSVGAAGAASLAATAAAISTAAGMGLSLGFSIVLSGVLSLMAGAPNGSNKSNNTDSSARAQNDSFGALQNTTATNTSIPLIFGHMRVAGQFVGGHIKTINHDAQTVVSVANYV
jgi:predicted phage tail protein